MKRLFIPIIMLSSLVLSAGCINGGEDISVSIEGTQTQTLSLDDIKDLPSVEGYGGRKNSVGQITLPTEFKGIPLTILYELDHNLSSDSAIRVGADDGYLATFSYNQFINGIFVTYDGSGNEILAGELTIILAYEEDGKPIPKEAGGPLRLVIIGPDKPISDGHWWVRFVNMLQPVNIEQ